MSLLKTLLLTQSVGAGKPAIIFPTEYVFTGGTSPYNVMYDYIGNVGAPVSIYDGTSSTVTSYCTQRKLIRLSDGTLYAIYLRQLALKYQIYVKKSVNDGATWTGETLISTYAGMSGYDQTAPSIAVDSNDYLHVVWAGKATGYTTYNQIWYALYNGAWKAPILLTTGGGMSTTEQRMAHITVDQNNYLHVIWAGYATGYSELQIWYNKYTTSWAGPVRISTLTGMSTRPQTTPNIAVDGDGNIHVAWLGNVGFTIENQIWYSKYTTSWSTPINISNDAPYEKASPCIAIDSNNYLHVVWTGRSATYPANYQIWYRKYTTSWGSIARLSNYSGMDSYSQLYPTIAADSDDNVHVLWYGKATGYTNYDKVWYAVYTTSWATPACLQATGQNIYPTLRWSRWP